MPEDPNSTSPELDVVIVGGGAAGLSAALVLGRCLRRVVVVDAGNPRNKAARMFNGYLSRDGSDPAEFLAISREQLRRYRETVELRSGSVKEARRGKNHFDVVLEDGTSLTSRTLLVASGLVDLLPAFENFQDFYGKTVHSCPYCDGWEVRGQVLVVTGGDQAAADLAIELLLWSRKMTLCTNGPLKCDRKTKRLLKKLEVPIIEREIKALEGEEGNLSGVRFIDGTILPCEALFFAPPQHQRSVLAEQLGCDFCKEDNCIQCGENAETSVPGVYAAGNCSKGIQLVVSAVAQGMEAAFAINNALLDADAKSGALRKAGS